ncbi:14-3-3 protein epsilon [Echinococcus granulosus]|uniref:14-3-3 protein n=1 Tax=Echinococcus granulosus TaxID=6210 RepID=A0A068WD09_ECHGR|nr:14-3-3 protein epsilon [Echinococcus granulosus]CDS15498.1 14-3-3 protein [Echinococcus granulosus]
MVIFMDSILRMNVELKAEERNLLSTAYKNALLPRRRAWDEITVAVQNAEKSGSSEYQYFLKYRETIEAEIRLMVEQEPDVKAFYYKLNGDCYRYLAEFETGNDRSDCAEHSLNAYKNAFEIASGNLAPTNPLRLGIALNFAAFYFDIVHAVDKAYKLLQAAYDDAIAEIDNLSEEPYKESAIVMKLLKENMRLWLPYMQSEECGCRGRPRS